MKNCTPRKTILTTLLSMLFLTTLLKANAQITELTEIVIGNGVEESNKIPFPLEKTSSAIRSYTESIYPASSIGAPSIIYSISFDVAHKGTWNPCYYDLIIYLGTTTEDNYSSTTGWTPSENMTVVYNSHSNQVPLITQTGWKTIVLEQPFYYEGNNLVVGVGMYGYEWSSGQTASIWNTSSEGASLNIQGTSSEPSSNAEGTIFDIRPNIKLGLLTEAIASKPTSIDIGPRPNNCWIAPYNAFLVNEGVPVSITSVSCDNNYFAFSGLETPIDCSVLENVPFDLLTGAGEEGPKTGNLTVNYGNSKSLVIPLNATVYSPTTADVWETAPEIGTFPYEGTITSDMAVYNNYRLPGSRNDGKDVVYKLVFDTDVILTASVNGENGKTVLYRSGFEGQGGPTVDNFYYLDYEHGRGLYSINFEDGSFGDYNWKNNSANPWVITTNDSYEGSYCLKSNIENKRNTTTHITLESYLPYTVTFNFRAKISSRGYFDKGYFFIDGITKIDGIHGNGEWTYYSYVVPQGFHTFRWEYRKANSGNGNDDCFYVDNISFGDVYDSELNIVDERLVLQVVTIWWHLQPATSSR